MTREEELRLAFGKMFRNPKKNTGRGDVAQLCYSGFKHGVEWAEQHPSDELIMLILNCIGYEEESWIEFVRKELEKRNGIQG